MAVQVQCPSCQRCLMAQTENIGRQFRCPLCGATFILGPAAANLPEAIEPEPLPQPVTADDGSDWPFDALPPVHLSGGPRAADGIHPQRILIMVGAGGGALGTFLPWVHVPIVGSVSGAHGGDGWITLALFVPAFALSLTGKRAQPLASGMRFGAALPALLAALICIGKLSDLHQVRAEVSRAGELGAAVAASFGIGVGLYLIVAAGLAVAIVALAMNRNPDNRQATLTQDPFI